MANFNSMNQVKIIIVGVVKGIRMSLKMLKSGCEKTLESHTYFERVLWMYFCKI